MKRNCLTVTIIAAAALVLASLVGSRAHAQADLNSSAYNAGVGPQGPATWENWFLSRHNYPVPVKPAPVKRLYKVVLEGPPGKIEIRGCWCFDEACVREYYSQKLPDRSILSIALPVAPAPAPASVLTQSQNIDAQAEAPIQAQKPPARVALASPPAEMGLLDPTPTPAETHYYRVTFKNGPYRYVWGPSEAAVRKYLAVKNLSDFESLEDLKESGEESVIQRINEQRREKK